MTIREFQKKLIGDGVSPKMARHIAGAAKEIYRLYFFIEGRTVY